MSKVTQVLLSVAASSALVILDSGKIHGLNVNEAEGQGALEVAKDAENGKIAEYLDAMDGLFQALGEDATAQIEADAKALKDSVDDWKVIYEAA